jgi:hypothetical protein
MAAVLPGEAFPPHPPQTPIFHRSVQTSNVGMRYHTLSIRLGENSTLTGQENKEKRGKAVLAGFFRRIMKIFFS